MGGGRVARPMQPVRVKPGWLKPALAEQYDWGCARHHAAGEEQCVKRCCGACYFLTPGEGCQLGSMRPVRCKTYPLVPMKDKVVLHERCPAGEDFLRALRERDPKAEACLDLAIAFADLAKDESADDNSEEIRWMVGYVEGGFKGTTLWRRPKTR